MQDTLTTVFLNFYECSECGTKWADEWSCVVQRPLSEVLL